MSTHDDNTLRHALLAAWRAGDPIDEIAQQHKISRTRVQRTLRGYVTDADRAERWRNRGERTLRTYTDDDLLAAVKSAADSSSTTGPTRSQYETHRQHDSSAPSFDTIVARFGSWNAAVTAAGYTRTKSSTRRVWTDDALLDTVKSIAAQHDGRLPSLRAYERERATHTDRPSAILLRVRFGGWARVRELAR